MVDSVALNAVSFAGGGAGWAVGGQGLVVRGRSGVGAVAVVRLALLARALLAALLGHVSSSSRRALQGGTVARRRPRSLPPGSAPLRLREQVFGSLEVGDERVHPTAQQRRPNGEVLAGAARYCQDPVCVHELLQGDADDEVVQL